MANPVLRQAETVNAFDNKFDTAENPGPLGALGGQSAILTSQLNKLITSSNSFNPLRDSTRHWKDVNYRDGDEDNIPEVPWAFFKERIQDPDVVDTLQKLHADTSKKFEALEAQSMEKEYQEMEEFFLGVHQWMSDLVKPMEAMVGDIDSDIARVKSIQDNAREWTTAELWAKEPKMSAQIQSDWDNNRWAIKSDHPE